MTEGVELSTDYMLQNNIFKLSQQGILSIVVIALFLIGWVVSPVKSQEIRLENEMIELDTSDEFPHRTDIKTAWGLLAQAEFASKGVTVINGDDALVRGFELTVGDTSLSLDSKYDKDVVIVQTLVKMRSEKSKGYELLILPADSARLGGTRLIRGTTEKNPEKQLDFRLALPKSSEGVYQTVISLKASLSL